MSALLCRYGQALGEQCQNEATIDAFRQGEPSLCEQHVLQSDLFFEQDEWEIARDYVEGFAKIVKVIDIRPLFYLTAGILPGTTGALLPTSR